MLATITKITVQKKATDRYNIYLDDSYAFAVDEEVLIRHQLKKGKELTELEMMQIQYEDEIRKAFNQTIHFLSFRMRSEQEIRTYLHKKEWDEPVIDTVIMQLYERKYIDDLEFAKAYALTQINGGKKGPFIIKRELKEKGIKNDFIEQAMQQFSKEMQVELAVRLGNKVVNKYKTSSEQNLKQKLEQYLMTKGFSFDIIAIAIEEIEYEKNDSDEWQALLIQGEKAKRRYKNYTGYEYKQRMKQALFRKGFSIDMIERYIEENE